jgi:acyl-CoA synthetase (AMP-forming)/AMP-acid ligase II
MSHIAGDLLAWARNTPDAPFLIDESGGVYTYGEVAAAARRFAGALRQRGIEAGDRVLLPIPNGPDYVFAYYGTLIVGGIAVGLRPTTTKPDLAHVTANCQPRLCVTGSDRQAPEPILPPECGIVRSGDLLQAPSYGGEPIGGDREIGQIIYTSGTTGKSKGVMLSHNALRASTSGIIEYLALTSKDRIGVLLDFVYSYGNSLLHTHCRVGASLALLHGLAFPARVVDLLERRSCTGLSGVPSTFALLLQRGQMEGRSLPALRYLTCAGGALPAANLLRLQRLLPRVEIFLMYGQTEASARLSYLPPSQLERRPNSIGKGMPGVTLEVLDPNGQPVKSVMEGEIVASGESLMTGYWGDREATRQTLREGKLWTGDLAMVDEEGFIHITGRRSDLINTGAFRVHPLEIEDAIIAMDGVHECVVVGAPDALWGEAIVACFQEGASPPLSEIRRHLRGLLPEYKWPRKVVEVAVIPRTASGKPRRRELARQLAGASLDGPSG